jgi:hypothetical protein
MGSGLSFQWNTQLIYKNMNEGCTSLNDLSNDLILEIFDYLSFNEIYLSFADLNARFNILIESYPHHFDFQSNERLPNHIRSLKMTQRFQLNLFSSLGHTQLSSLRALSLGNLRSEQIVNVFKKIQLKELEYIYLGVCMTDGIESRNAMTSIQKEIFTLGQYKLKQLHLRNNLLTNFNDLPQTLPSLKHFQVVGCEDFYILSQLIFRMPNLKYLQASIMNLTERIPISNSHHITNLILRPHSNCLRKELGTFLKNCCSYLKRLVIELQVYKNEQSTFNINKDEWLTIFPCRLRNFHWKLLPHPTDYHTNMSDLRKSPLQEKILLFSTDQQEHYCQVIIDAPFIPIWQKSI